MAGYHTARRRIHLLIAGRDRSFAGNLVSSFSSSDSVEVVGIAYRTEEAVEAATALLPDAVLIEVDGLGAKGVEALRRITTLQPRPQIILLGQPGSPSLRRAAEAGIANAYVSRQHAESVCRIVLGFVLASAVAH